MSKWKYTERVDLGYTRDGRRIQKRAYGNSKAELERSKQALYREYQDIRCPEDMTFGEFADRWYKTYKTNLSIETARKYKTLFKCFGRLENMRLRDVERMDIQQVLNEKASAPFLAKQLRGLFRAIFQCAANEGYISRNPAYNLDVPKTPKKEHIIIDERLLAGIRDADLSDQERLMVNILYLFGLRPAEALALMPGDFKSGQLTVSRALTWDAQKPIIKSTKTGNIRRLPVPDGFTVPQDRLYLFVGRDGLMHRSEWQYMWVKIKEKINVALGGNKNLCVLDPDFSAYTFRRTFATDLYYSGVSIKKAAQLMGHADTTMILKVYAQLDDEREDLKEVVQRARNVI